MTTLHRKIKSKMVRMIIEEIQDNGYYSKMYIHLAVVNPETKMFHPGISDLTNIRLTDEGVLVLDITPGAVGKLHINEFINITARFSGVPRDLIIPVDYVIGVSYLDDQMKMHGFNTPFLLDPDTISTISNEEPAPKSVVEVPTDEGTPVSLYRKVKHLTVIK